MCRFDRLFKFVARLIRESTECDQLGLADTRERDQR